MYLIVGLGNPGSEYDGTRHNVGWAVVDALAVKMGWTNKSKDFNRQARQKLNALTMDGPAASDKALLLKPTTFMNLSGSSVRQAMDFYRLEPKDVMVVLDDLALPCGKIRIRAGGSHGGHNGLRDIERVLGTREYPRLRVGIDPPPGRMPGRDYVLGAFTPAQLELIEPATDRAADAIVKWMQSGINAVMNEFNQSGDSPAGE